MTPALQTELNNQFEFRLIDYDLIDDPKAPERETMDPKALAELSESIAEVGLIKPLIVKPMAGRFEVVAGHRRKIACGLAGYSPVPCRVKVNGKVTALSIMIHENAHTEAVNAIEEARFFLQCLDEECGNDVDVLCAKTKRRREYVEGRLNLLNGYPRVVVAIEQSLISIGVGEQLNRVKDPNQLLLLLDQAINQGASVRTVTQWVREANMQEPIQLPPDEAVDPNAPPAPPIANHMPKCFFCRTSKHPHTMKFLYMHEPCADIVREALNLPDPDAPAQQLQ